MPRQATYYDYYRDEMDGYSAQIHPYISEMNMPNVQSIKKKLAMKEKMDSDKAKATVPESRFKIDSIAHIQGFHFYIQTTVSGPYVDPFSDKPREYYVENESTKQKANLPDALKIGQVGNVDIPNEMYEFIHEYDKGLD